MRVKRMVTVMLLVLSIPLFDCAALQKKIDEVDPCICDGCGLDCTCADPVRHIDCLEPTNPCDEMLFQHCSSPISAKREWRRSDLKHLSRKPKASPSSSPSAAK